MQSRTSSIESRKSQHLYRHGQRHSMNIKCTIWNYILSHCPPFSDTQSQTFAGLSNHRSRGGEVDRRQPVAANLGSFGGTGDFEGLVTGVADANWLDYPQATDLRFIAATPVEQTIDAIVSHKHRCKKR